MYPNCHKPVSKGDKINCGTCCRYDWDKRKCRDKAEQYVEWDKSHRKWEREMQSNRGVYLDG